MTPSLLLALLSPQAQTAIEQTIAHMTVEEKAAQLQSGATALPKAKLPAYDYWNEGLHGLARNGVATVFPQAIGLAATWDQPLMQKVGDVISTEARARYNGLPKGGDRLRYQGLTIWSPNINIYRDPRWGRGQETYGEDPYLTGHMAKGFVTGLQGPDLAHPKVIATPKHLAVHSGPEAGRDSFSVEVSPRDMEETYSAAFRTALVEGKALSVMCAYNALHGVPVCASPDLMGKRLRQYWNFGGLTVSDCDAIGNITHYHFYTPDDAAGSAAALKAGTDLDCGRTYAALPDAVKRGLVGEDVLDSALSRVFAARALLGDAFGQTSPWSRIAPTQVDTAEHRALALEAARKSIVLLQNKGNRLPLAVGAKIAVIGPNADALDVLEANYHGTASHPVTPLEGLRARFGADKVLYAQGSAVAEGVPVTIPEDALSADGKSGLKGEYFATPDLSGTPRLTRQDRHVDFDWDRASPAPGLPAKGYAVRWTGQITPPAAGDYRLHLEIPRCFDCSGHDPVRLWIDGEERIADSGDGKNIATDLTFSDTKPHQLRIEYRHTGEDGGIGLRWIAPAQTQRDQAVALAQNADAVVAFIGLAPSVEGEALQIEVPGFAGGDRTAIELPEPQRKLLEAVAATGKPLVLVLMSGGAVAMPWARDHADAVLAAWYPGEAGGTALADVLSGAANPSGRLPLTFYAGTRDLPAFADYNMRERTYRYYTGKPVWGFGHGLSYTSFTYGQPALSAPAADRSVSATIAVTNSGTREGDEVVQVYLAAPQVGDGSFNDPVLQRSLVGFQRVHLKPGETRQVRFDIDARGQSTVDRAGLRKLRQGAYHLWIGAGQPGDGPGAQADYTVQTEAEIAP